MEVDALSKGGKSQSGKGNSATCWACDKTCHMSRDCYYNKGTSKGKGKSGKAFVEATTSLEIAHPTKVTSQVERAKARATRKARTRTRARTRACSRLISDTWSEK